MLAIKTFIFSIRSVCFQVNLVRTEMSTAKSKYTRDVAELREKLERALSNSERDQTARDKILNDAKVEILTLSKKVGFTVEYRTVCASLGSGNYNKKVLD